MKHFVVFVKMADSKIKFKELLAKYSNAKLLNFKIGARNEVSVTFLVYRTFYTRNRVIVKQRLPIYGGVMLITTRSYSDTVN